MDAAPHPTNPTTPTQLPPEALDLATKLFNHAREGQTPPLRQYIEAGIPVNLTNHKGDTLLMLAAYHGNIETVKMLVEKGADVNGLNERGQSPVAGVVFKGYEEVVRVLVEAGADVWRGQPTAVDSARMFRRGEMLKLFGVEEEGQG
ncbi:ankyrin [Teratosphaeria nubilosa]|uniref:Ankyrin n=1 Tax=Teratosphaeria nubilosa TaxID=161662 RepID=A0A6G1LA29_9PEZI|nr:ankyrin [Teratosphaeria nubilosa]